MSQCALSSGLICATDRYSGVDYAFQALAIDEQRITFPPTMWHKAENAPAIELEQCWFPGVHANLGGQGEVPASQGDHGEIGNITFAWMVSDPAASRLAWAARQISERF